MHRPDAIILLFQEYLIFLTALAALRVIVGDQEGTCGHIDRDCVDCAGLKIVVSDCICLIYSEFCKCIGQLLLRILKHVISGCRCLDTYDFAGEVSECLDLRISRYKDTLGVVGVCDAPCIIVLAAFLGESGPDAVTAACVQFHILGIPVERDRLIAPAEVIADCLAELNVKTADGRVILAIGIRRIIKVKTVLECKARISGSLCRKCGLINVICFEAQVIFDVRILLTDCIICAVQDQSL